MMYTINDTDGEPVKLKPTDEKPVTFTGERAAEIIRLIWIQKGILSEGAEVVPYEARPLNSTELGE